MLEFFLNTAAVSLSILFAAVLTLFSPTAIAVDAALAWDASTSSNVGGYKVHWGLSSRSYSNNVDVGNTTNHTLTGLDAAETYYIAVTTYDVDGNNQSAFSNEVSVAGPGTLGASPTSMAFSAVVVGETSAPQTIQLIHQGGPGDLDIEVQAIALSASAFSDDFSGPVTLAPGQSTTFNVTFAPTSEGSASATLQITHDGSNSPLAVPLTGTGSAPLPASVLYRINAGGPALSGTQTWSADTGSFVNTGNSSLKSGAIDLTHPSLPAGTPEALLQSERYDPTTAPDMQWDFPVTPGTYEVRLYWAESWSGGQGPGLRVFDVSIEGALVLNGYDVYADVGGFKGVMKAFVVNADANLDIDFSHGAASVPMIKGIEILEISGPASPPVAAFTGTPETGVSPLTVTFSDASTGNITSRSWNFGDGATSTAQNPTHLYTASGSHSVSLTVTGPGGSHTETKAGYVSVGEPVPVPVADFNAAPTSGTTPLTVDFTDASNGAVTSWSWSFGDGTTSAAQNPSHVYTASGSHSVSLTVTGPGGSHTETKTNYIQVISSDSDGDGVAAIDDNCPSVANPSQTDTDGDGQGDACDADDDGDGVPDVDDAFPLDAREGLDTDGDGMGDDYEGRFGLNPNDPSDAALDTDGDGASNVEEFARHRNPRVNEHAVIQGILSVMF